ncbi:hypothetical protein R1sor_001799 [Riccia sorocarpa]|uniref:Uncharacterized protein n=1 Tax=Riccia sorocarpa TaxID=122646 RepID=A0ABD3GWY3_9MARC
MDADTLKNKNRWEKSKEVWLEDWSLSNDPVVAWELAWGRLREKFKEFGKENREKLSKLKEAHSKLAAWREKPTAEWTKTDKVEYSELEKKVREVELQEANILKRRSRIKWVEEGDANSNFFFSCLKTKQTQEMLVELKDEGGNSTTDEKEILDQIHMFYQDLYHQPQIPEQVEGERREILKLTSMFATSEDNNMLRTAPNLAKIEKILATMARNKAPCGDGLTVEVVIQTWEWISPSLYLIFLGIGLYTTGYQKLEGPCQIFLWGKNSEGKSKTALVAWKENCKRKYNSGLGIKSFQDVEDTLKMKSMGRFLEGKNVEWAKMFRYLVHDSMKRRIKGKDYKWWTVEEGLLLLPTVPAPNNSLVKHFVASWMRFRKLLTLDKDEWIIPGTLTMQQIALLNKHYGQGRQFSERLVLPLRKKIGIQFLMQLTDGAQGCIDVKVKLTNKGVVLTRTQEEELEISKHG